MNFQQYGLSLGSAIKISLWLATGALALVSAWNIYGYVHEGKVDLSGLQFDERHAYWEKRIHEVGRHNAYNELSVWVKDLNTNKKHFEAHIFGDSLYRADGLQGVDVCDGKFNYACFHAFMIQAVEDDGIEVVTKLNDACKNQLDVTAAECVHGIGHGILGVLGYEPKNIEDALHICESLSAGCPGGVFMEYGIRGMQFEGSDSVRPFAIDEVLEPCAHLQNMNFLPSCAHW